MPATLSVNSHIIYVIGCPGAGKSTLCARLAVQLGWAHISVGHELRRHTRENEQTDDIVAQCVRSGTLVPIDRLAKILECRIEHFREQGCTSFIIDGFPRCVSQIEFLQDLLGSPEQVVCMDCPKNIARVRVLARRDTSRVDDEELFEKRFAEFCVNNVAVVAYFEGQNKLKKISTGYDTEVSFVQLLATLQRAPNEHR